MCVISTPNSSHCFLLGFAPFPTSYSQIASTPVHVSISSIGKWWTRTWIFRTYISIIACPHRHSSQQVHVAGHLSRYRCRRLALARPRTTLRPSVGGLVGRRPDGHKNPIGCQSQGAHYAISGRADGPSHGGATEAGLGPEKRAPSRRRAGSLWCPRLHQQTRAAVSRVIGGYYGERRRGPRRRREMRSGIARAGHR